MLRGTNSYKSSREWLYLVPSIYLVPDFPQFFSGVPPTGRFAPEESTVFVAARKVFFYFSFLFCGVALHQRREESTVFVAARKYFTNLFQILYIVFIYNIMWYL